MSSGDKAPGEAEPRSYPNTTMASAPPRSADSLSMGETLPSSDVESARPPAAPIELAGEGGFSTRYQLADQLGEGGMGVVHLCRDHRIGREVAMKVVRLERDGGELSPRFLREAQVQGQLEHPSIVPVYDVGRDPQGALYFTMKRVHGLTLEEILEGLQDGNTEIVEKYSRRKLLTAFGSVCLAVEFAHSRGILHRDLKPGNVMLGDFGEVYLLDWGLAKLMGMLGPRPEAGGARPP